MKRDEWLDSLRKRGWSDADISRARFTWNAAERATREDCARICDAIASEFGSTAAKSCSFQIRESIK